VFRQVIQGQKIPFTGRRGKAFRQAYGNPYLDFDNVSSFPQRGIATRRNPGKESYIRVRFGGPTAAPPTQHQDAILRLFVYGFTGAAKISGLFYNTRPEVVGMAK